MAKACSKHRDSDRIVARSSNRKPHLCGAALSAGRRGVRNAWPWGAASRRHLVLLCHGQQIQALLVHRREHGPIDRVPVLLGTRLQLSPIVHVALQLRKLRGEVTALRVRLVLGLGGGALQHLTEDGIQIVPLLQRGRPLTGHVRWVMRGVRMRQEPQNGAQQTYGAQCLLRLKGWPWVLPEALVPDPHVNGPGPQSCPPHGGFMPVGVGGGGGND